MKLMLVLMQPPGQLLQVLLNEACELAPQLAHVQSARVLERRTDADGSLVVVQHWRARAGVPELLQPHLDAGLQDWQLTLRQPPGEERLCFDAESAAVQVPGRCQGALRLHSAVGGRGTRIELSAEFPASSEGLRTIFATLLARHWRALAEAAAARLSAKAG